MSERRSGERAPASGAVPGPARREQSASAVRRFLDRTPMAAGIAGADAVVRATNDHLAVLLRRDPGSLDGFPAGMLVHPDDRTRAAAELAELLAGRRPSGVRDRFRVERGDGTWLEAEVIATDLLDDPAIAGVLFAVVPVEQRYRHAAWFEAVVRQMADAVAVLDDDGRILFAGPGVEALFGTPADAVVGRRLQDVVASASARALQPWLDDLLARPGHRSTTSWTIARPAGPPIAIDIQATNLLDDPLVQGAVLVLRDVTDYRLVEAEARLAARLLEASPVVVMATDATGRITAWNPAAEHILGWTADEAIGWGLRELGANTPISRSALLDDFPTLLRGGQVSTETEIRRKDGTIVPLYVVTCGLLDDAGAFGGFLVIALDLSERHAVRQAIAQTEGRWSALASRARELVAILDEATTTIYAGPGFGSLLGYAPDELLGTPLRDLFHPDDRTRVGGLDDALAGKAEALQRDYRIRHADGGWRVVEIEITDQRDEPYVRGFVLIGRDVTQRAATEAAHAHLTAAIESTGAAVVVLGLDHRVVAWNRGAERLLGWPAEEAIGSTPPLAPIDPEAVAAVEQAGASRHFEAAAMRRDGERLLLAVNGSPVRDAGGAVVATTWVAFDVTDQRAADREREARAAQQSVIAAVTGRALGGAAVDDLLEDAARLAAGALGVDVRAELHEGPPGEETPAGTVVSAIEGRDGAIGRLTATTGDDEPLADSDVAFLHALASVLGTVVDRSRVSDEMRRRALHDDLTDLPNRTLLVDRLDQAMVRRDRRHEQLAVLFVDLDRFKRVNDTLGHAAGDELLVETARRIIGAVRAGDTVARAGGDEFVVLCEDIAGEVEARELAGRIVEAVAKPFAVRDVDVVVTASVGVVVADESSDAESLVHDADLAMYRAKQRGRARVETFDAEMRDEVASRLGLEQALREAVVDRRLTVVYQPQVDLHDGRLLGLEALVRWSAPGALTLEPADLIGMADEIGLLDEISWFVLEQTCSTAARLQASGGHADVTVAVNLGARQLGDAELVARVEAALAATGVPPSALVIEVTETDVVEEAAARTLGALRALGVRVSLDDFGTGWSSLHRLTRLPVDELKIDQSFVAGVGSDAGCDAVVRAVCSLADELGLRVVAEGVERPDQRERLVALGCRIGQGWLLGGPVAADELRS